MPDRNPTVRMSKVVFSNTIFESLGSRVLFWAGFSSAEWFGTEFREFSSIFVPRNGIPSCFLFRWRVRKGIPRVCFYFCSTKRNIELFSLPLKCSEGNYESLLLFLFNGTEFRVVFSSAEGFGTEFRGFRFRGTAGNPSEITICSVYSVFRGIIFLPEIPNPISTPILPHSLLCFTCMTGLLFPHGSCFPTDSLLMTCRTFPQQKQFLTPLWSCLPSYLSCLHKVSRNNSFPNFLPHFKFGIPASAFRHPVSQPCTGAFRYRTGPLNPVTNWIRHRNFCSLRYRTDWMPDSSTIRHLKKLLVIILHVHRQPLMVLFLLNDIEKSYVNAGEKLVQHQHFFR